MSNKCPELIIWPTVYVLVGILCNDPRCVIAMVLLSKISVEQIYPVHETDSPFL